MSVQIVHATSRTPGAIAIIQLIGPSLEMLRALTGVEDWPLHKIRLTNLGGIDEGLAVRLREDVTQLMPHGGIRIVQRITAHLVELGASVVDDRALNPLDLYPEARDRLEAIMLATLARAQSPLAIDLLLDQPRRWREFVDSKGLSDEDRSRSTRLNRLIDPPFVVLAGPPNVGKSTLTNALIGRALSIAYDLPGTTRDYTAGRIDLGGVVVDWYDTPGFRDAADPIEQRAIELAARLVHRADLLIAMRDSQTEWMSLPREPDLRVINKIDLVGRARSDRAVAIQVSAKTGKGLADLVTASREALVPQCDLDHPGPWLFDERLLNGTTSSHS